MSWPLQAEYINSTKSDEGLNNQYSSNLADCQLESFVAGCPHTLEEQELYLSIALFERINALPFAGRNLQASAAKPSIASFPRTLELCQPRHLVFWVQTAFQHTIIGG